MLVIAIGARIFYDSYAKHQEAMYRIDSQSEKSSKTFKVEGLLDNIDELYANQEKLYNDAVSKGATPEQLKSMKAQLDQLGWIKSNQLLARLLAPLINSVPKLLSGFLK